MYQCIYLFSKLVNPIINRRSNCPAKLLLKNSALAIYQVIEVCTLTKQILTDVKRSLKQYVCSSQN